MSSVATTDTPLLLLLRQQLGLLTARQATSLGLSEATLRRRLRRPTGCWCQVLPRVYAAFAHDLTPQQRVVAALLYAGEDAVVTGLAALALRGFRYAPRPDAVDVLVPAGRRPASRAFVRVRRTTRMPRAVLVRGIRTAPVARAVADACSRLTGDEDGLAIAAEAVQRRLTTTALLEEELAEGPRRGSALLRRSLLPVSAGARSVAEGLALSLFRAAGLPAPVVNGDLHVGGRWVARPDFRWGRLIVEIDSKEWHLLTPGSWEATQRRRRRLERLGFDVLVVTPDELRRHPREVVDAIRRRLGSGHHG